MKQSRRKLFKFFYLKNNFNEKAIGIFVENGLTYGEYYRISKKILTAYLNFFNDLGSEIIFSKYLCIMRTEHPILFNFKFENKNEFDKFISRACFIIRNVHNNYKSLLKKLDYEDQIVLINHLSSSFNDLKSCSLKQLKSDLNNRLKKYKDFLPFSLYDTEQIPNLTYKYLICQLKLQFSINLVTCTIRTGMQQDLHELVMQYQIVMDSIEKQMSEGSP